MRLGALGILALLFILTSALGQIHVLAPPQLVKTVKNNIPSGVIPGSTGTFGAPTYGESFQGRLWFVEDASGKNYCTNDYIKEMKSFTKNATVPTMPSVRNVFVLRRGDCPFVSKVKIAESEGHADCVIVVDEKSTKTGGQQRTRSEIQHIIMADDGSGHHIRIPSIMVAYDDGQMLVDGVKSNINEPVIVNIDWSIPQKHTVRVDFWTDAGRRMGIDFLQQFASHAEALRGHLDFHTHYNVFPFPTGDSADMCLSESREFCDDAPEGTSNISGKEVLMENVRQMCIWSRTATPVSKGENSPLYSSMWWKYVQKYGSECKTFGRMAQGPVTEGNKQFRLGEPCSKRVMKLVGIDTQQIDQCVASDWRKLLETEKDNKAWNVIALRINDVRFSGNLEPQLVSRAICSAFQESPTACHDLINVSPPVSVIHQGVSGSTVFFLFCLAVTSLGCGLFLYQRYVKKTMRSTLRQEVMLEVKAQMQEYYQMDEFLNLPEDFRQSRPLVR